MYRDLNAPSFLFNNSAWFTHINSTYPEIFNESFFLSDNMTSFFMDALTRKDTDPCINYPDLEKVGMDKICEAFDENNLTNVLLEADYPVDLCHSKTDALITIENVPDRSILKFELDGPDHGSSTFICDAKLFGSNEIEKPTLRSTKASKAPNTGKSQKMKKSKEPKRSWEEYGKTVKKLKKRSEE